MHIGKVMRLRALFCVFVCSLTITFSYARSCSIMRNKRFLNISLALFFSFSRTERTQIIIEFSTACITCIRYVAKKIFKL